MTRAQREEKVLAGSLALFARRGFAATKTKDVARAAGVSEAMVFKLFPDKGSLYRKLIERKISEAESVLPLAALAQSREPPERFFAGVASVMLGRIDEDPSFLRLLLFSALEDHPLSREFDEARAQGLRSAIETYVVRQQRAGVIRRVEPEFASRAFMSLVAWFALARTVFKEPGSRKFSREKLVRELVSLFLGGVRAK